MSGPLKDYNFQERGRDKQIKPVVMTERQKPVEISNAPKPANDKELSKTRNPDSNVNKISLQEYRDRVKAKSPNKPDNANEHRNNYSNDQGKTFASVRENRPRSERAMSTDDIPLAEMSVDLANMSIDNTEDGDVNIIDNGRNKNIQSNAGIGQKVHLQDRDMTGLTMSKNVKDFVDKQSHENRLKLKKAVSSSQCSSQSGQGLTSSSKSYGSLPSSTKPDNAERSKSGAAELNKAETKVTGQDTMTGSSDNMSNKTKPKEAVPIQLSLADRLKLKAAGVKVYVNGKEDNPEAEEKQRTGSGTSSQTGSQSEVIDLTEDEESPEPVKPKQTSATLQEPVRPKHPSVNIAQAVKLKQSNAPVFAPFKPPQNISKVSGSDPVRLKQHSTNVPGENGTNQSSTSSKQFGQNQHMKMSSFQSLSAQSSAKPTNLPQTGDKGSSQGWTELRGQTGAAGLGNQSSTLSQDRERLKVSLQDEISRRNQLTKLLEKQKVMYGAYF